MTSPDAMVQRHNRDAMLQLHYAGGQWSQLIRDLSLEQVETIMQDLSALVKKYRDGTRWDEPEEEFVWKGEVDLNAQLQRAREDIAAGRTVKYDPDDFRLDDPDTRARIEASLKEPRNGIRPNRPERPR